MQARKTIKHINAEEDDNDNGLCLDVPAIQCSKG